MRFPTNNPVLKEEELKLPNTQFYHLLSNIMLFSLIVLVATGILITSFTVIQTLFCDGCCMTEYGSKPESVRSRQSNRRSNSRNEQVGFLGSKDKGNNKENFL